MMALSHVTRASSCAGNMEECNVTCRPHWRFMNYFTALEQNRATLRQTSITTHLRPYARPLPQQRPREPAVSDRTEDFVAIDTSRQGLSTCSAKDGQKQRHKHICYVALLILHLDRKPWLFVPWEHFHAFCPYLRSIDLKRIARKASKRHGARLQWAVLAVQGSG